MPNIKIVTDSTAGLSEDEIQKFNITVLPLTVRLNDKAWLPTNEADYANFIKTMEASKVLPQTSQPAIGTMVETFDKLTADGSQVLAISLTKNLSGTVDTFRQAADMVDGDVTVIDSQFIARGLAFQVLAAAELAQQGATKEEIINRITFIGEHTRLFIVVLNLDNLAKGGRIGKMTSAIGHLLSIKLIAELTADGLEAKAKVRSEKQVHKFFEAHFKEASSAIKHCEMMHAMNEDTSVAISKTIQAIRPEIKTVPQYFADPIIASHAGAGAFAVMYCTE